MRLPTIRRLASGTSVLALTAMASTFGGKARAQTMQGCVEGATDVFVCSGTQSDSQVVAGAETATVTTDAIVPFSVNTSADEALNIRATGDVSYDDDNAASLTALASMGLYGRSTDGNVSFSSDGEIFGEYGGIYGKATNGRVEIETGAGNVGAGDGSAIYAYAGAGGLSVTTGSGEVGSLDDAIVGKADGGDVSITTGQGAVYGKKGGIDFSGRAASVEINTGAGSVTGYNRSAVSVSTEDGGDVTVNAGSGSLYSRFGNTIYVSTETDALSKSGASTVTVTTGEGSVINRYSSAISVGTDVDNINITTGAELVYGGEYGIDARTNYGEEITITTGAGEVTAGEYGYAIRASIKNGPGVITITTGEGDVTGGRGGIYASSGDGRDDIEITTGAGAVTQTSQNSYGKGAVYAKSNGSGSEADGNITITIGEGGAENTGRGRAVTARNRGYGDITITTIGDVTAAKRGPAISASGRYGDVSVTTGAGTVQSGKGKAIAASAYGEVTVVTGDGDVIGGKGKAAIDARGKGNRYYGPIRIRPAAEVEESYGNVSVTTANGDIVGGIRASTYGKNGTVEVTTGAGTVSAESIAAIQASSRYGDITIVTSTGDVTGGKVGIYAKSSGSDATQSITTGSGAVSGEKFGIAAGTEYNDRSYRYYYGPRGAANGEVEAEQEFAGTINITVEGEVSGGKAGIYMTADAYSGSGPRIIIGPQLDFVVAGARQTTDDTTPAADEAKGAQRTVVITATGEVSGEIGIVDNDTYAVAQVYAPGSGDGSIGVKNVPPTITKVYSYQAVTSDITVAGTLEGGALLNAGDDRFTLEAGGTVTGVVDGGADLNETREGTPRPVGGIPIFQNPVGFASQGPGVLNEDADADSDSFIDTFVLGGDSAGAGIDGLVDLTGFDFDNDGDFADADLNVTGFEEFAKEGTSTFGLAGENDEKGLIAVNAGGIDVDGAFSALELDAAAGTTISGEGTLGSVTTLGTIAPGSLEGAGPFPAAVGDSSIGTLSFEGDVAFGAGSTLDVQVAGGNASDLVAATGAVSIDPTATVSASLELVTASVPDTSRFTVVTAGDGVTGEFGTVAEDIPDIDLTAEYDGDTVVLVASAAAQDPDLGEVADVSEKSLAAASAQAVVFDARTVAESMRSFVTEAVEAGNSTTASSRGPDASQYFGFGGVFGARADIDNDGADLGFDSTTRGILGGVGGVAQTEALGPLTYGLAVFSQSSDLDNANGSTDTDSVGIGAFAGFDVGAWSIDTGIAFAKLDFEFGRIVAPGLIANGETDGDATILSFEAAYNIDQPGPGGLIFAPYVGLDYVRVGYDSYTETGAGLLNLSVTGDTLEVGFARAGVRAETVAIEMNDGLFKSNLDIGLERSFGDTQATVNSALAALPGSVFSDTATSLDETRLTTGIGMSYQKGNVSAHVRYDGSFGSRTESHRASIGLDISF